MHIASENLVRLANAKEIIMDKAELLRWISWTSRVATQLKSASGTGSTVNGENTAFVRPEWLKATSEDMETVNASLQQLMLDEEVR